MTTTPNGVNVNKPKIVNAQWDIQIYVRCPHCNYDFDVLESYPDIKEYLPPTSLETVNGIDIDGIICADCKQEFTINNIIF